MKGYHGPCGAGNIIPINPRLCSPLGRHDVDSSAEGLETWLFLLGGLQPLRAQKSPKVGVPPQL